MGLRSMVFGGMVKFKCICLCVFRLSWALWLHMIMVVDGSSLAAILAQWRVLCWVGYDNIHSVKGFC
jgi:hypothetical protein